MGTRGCDAETISVSFRSRYEISRTKFSKGGRVVTPQIFQKIKIIKIKGRKFNIRIKNKIIDILSLVSFP